MAPTVAATSTSLSSNIPKNPLSSSSSSEVSKKGISESRLPPWTSPTPMTSQLKTSPAGQSSQPPKKRLLSPPRSSAVPKEAVPSTKKRKRSSPFRIKVGCIVALRHRSSGNHVTMVSPTGTRQVVLGRTSTNSYSEVWADPMPGRDEGFALIGRRIRCCFPKSVISDEADRRASSRILEGEIVSLVDYEKQWSLRRKKRQQRSPCPIVVELLVDRVSLITMPFLKRTDEGGSSTDKMSENEKKRLRYEEIIRGENKVTVQVTLADVSGISDGKEVDTHDSLEDAVARWVIRKRVPRQKDSGTKTQTDGAKSKNEGENKTITPTVGLETNGGENGSTPDGGTRNSRVKVGIQLKKRPLVGSNSNKPAKRRKTDGKKTGIPSATNYMGNGDDSPAQQERNWRWLAGRYYDLQKFDGQHDNDTCLDIVSSGMTGEVQRVTPTAKSTSSSTLAMVTLRRLIIPEQTKSGRMSNHGPFEIFDDRDAFMESHGKEAKDRTSSTGKDSREAANKAEVCLFQVPVEELVIVSRRCDRSFGESEGEPEKRGSFPLIQHSYSSKTDSFLRLATSESVESADEKSQTVCHKCRRSMPSNEMKPCVSSKSGTCQHDVERDSSQKNWWCAQCLSFLEYERLVSSDRNEKRGALSCCHWYCDCRSCAIQHAAETNISLLNVAREVADDIAENGGSFTANSQFASACSIVSRIRQTDFCLPTDFLQLSSLPVSSNAPMTHAKKRAVARRKKNGEGKKPPREAEDVSKASRNKSLPPLPSIDSMGDSSEEDHPFQPTCCRLLPYDQEKKHVIGVPRQQFTRQGSKNLSVREMQLRSAVHGDDSRQNIRSRGKGKDRAEKKTTSRAARANQRRMMKDVAAFGSTGLGLDALAGREQQLRFDKSLIHAWGVFADEAINAGEMIVEYRGELIGNAVAEKREKEYEMAKIGSDYMFRIDAHIVCDATKQGNVARFINASCSPNCYTKIITLNDVKRIVIYAKKDIKAGEELCYDYKFPLEYDESRRIKCYCGAPDCRGFMNWDKKYVAVPVPSGNRPNVSTGKAS